jgi:diguanylate cyclase (GGDEF)-like protein
MIWDSLAVMTIIDLIIISLAIFAIGTFFSRKRVLKEVGLYSGINLILCGLILIALFYMADLLTMYVFPMFMPMKKAMKIMRNLHLNYLWIVSVAVVLSIVTGLVYLIKNLIPKINILISDLKISKIKLEEDISKRKEIEDELKTLSLTDELTGLYNRRGFFNLSEQQLKLAKRAKEKVYMLYLDIDRFKEINDTFGHNEGDEALKDIAMILRDSYRESDVIGRIGGDEFVVFPIGTNYETIKIVVDRLLGKIDIHNKKSNKSYKLSISIGVANYDPKKPCSLDELLNQADKLMYSQKKNKKKSLSLLSPTNQ